MATAFTPLQTFEAKVNDINNRYVQGQRYVCRDGALYTDLRSKIDNWEADGLIRILGQVANRAPVAVAKSK